MGQASVRLFQEKDRQKIFRLAADTAFFGEPVEKFLDDRRLFNDSFVKYYLDFEDDCTWVVELDHHVRGYLTGCRDTEAQRERFLVDTIMPVVGKALRRRYDLGWKTWRFAFAMLGGRIREENPAVDTAEYPAHLHINIESGFRGQGFGKQLIRAFLRQLIELGIKGVHLNTTDRNEAACKLYEGVGFRLLHSHPTRVWSYLVPGLIENRVYGMELDG